MSESHSTVLFSYLVKRKLLDTRAAEYVLWFELRSIDEIISGLRITGNRMGAKYLEHWKEGHRDDLEERASRAGAQGREPGSVP